MVQKLPTHGLLWDEAEDFCPEKLDEHAKNKNRRYLLEVDVEYPKQLPKNHNELPFLAERMEIGRKN